MPQEAFLHKMKYSTDDIAIIVALEEELPETILPEFKIFYSGVGVMYLENGHGRRTSGSSSPSTCCT